MNENVVKQRRLGKEVLRLLGDHSPITMEMLRMMIEPPPPKKSLRKTVGVLRKAGLVDMLVGDGQTFFYQLHQSLPNRTRAASKFADDKPIPQRRLLRKQEWVHNQWCEYWALTIKRAFPKAQIVREHDANSDQIASNILLHDGTDLDLTPDLLLLFPTEKADQHKVSVALEIERTRKTDARIQRKLKKYIYETHLDGLIYICDSGRLSETIRLFYQQKTLERAHKKCGYADNFFLFSDAMSAASNPLATFYTASGKEAALDRWIHTLRATKPTLRRDINF